MSDKHDKTEEPTQKKLDEARERGSIARSKDLGSAAVLLTTASILTAGGRHLGGWLIELMRKGFSNDLRLELNGPRAAGELLGPLALDLLTHLAPFFLCALAAAVAAGLLQSGLNIATEPLMPSLKRFNPQQNIKRLLPSKQMLWSLAKNVTVIAVLGYYAHHLVWGELPRILALSNAAEPTRELLEAGGGLVADLVFRLATVLGLVGITDYLLARRKWSQDMKMSKKELRDEAKQNEGSPQVKGKRRQIAQRYSMNRMLADVPRADTIITNPTHYAIAIRYRRSTSPAPIVLAKGTDEMAQKIKAIARHHGILMVENRPLARALYSSSKVGKAIPAELYRAVAEVLAYVYRLSPPKDRDEAPAKGKGKGPGRPKVGS